MSTLHAFDYLEASKATAVPPVCVALGDEPFLKSLVLAELRRVVLAGDDGEFSLTRFDGRAVEARSVFDELATVALFGGGLRLIVVDDADDFVSEHRSALEHYVAHPRATGVLALVVQSWPANTRLAKAVAATGLAIECKAPAAAALFVGRAKRQHGAKLERDAAELLLEMAGDGLGLVDQELAKLAAAAGTRPITVELVEQMVGGWRAKTTWEMLDAAAEGRTRQALVELERLLLAGETPIGLLGQIGSTLRRFASATRFIEQAEAAGRPANLRQALEAAGVKPIPFVMNKNESQLRRLGRQRSGKLFQWVLDADLALKGSSSQPARARFVLEQLLARLGDGTQSA
jgi:DNA polymerase-3 subunit delta